MFSSVYFGTNPNTMGRLDWWGNTTDVSPSRRGPNDDADSPDAIGVSVA